MFFKSNYNEESELTIAKIQIRRKLERSVFCVILHSQKFDCDVSGPKLELSIKTNGLSYNSSQKTPTHCERDRGGTSLSPYQRPGPEVSLKGNEP